MFQLGWLLTWGTGHSAKLGDIVRARERGSVLLATRCKAPVIYLSAFPNANVITLQAFLSVALAQA